MVIAAEFIDPFQDDIVSFPIGDQQRGEWRANILELIVGAVIFLSVVAIYNALFSIWERIFQRRSTQNNGDADQNLQEQDDVFVRVTYAIFVVILAYLFVTWVGGKGRSLRSNKVPQVNV